MIIKNKVTDFLNCLAHFILYKRFKKSRDEGKKSKQLTFKTKKTDKVRMT